MAERLAGGDGGRAAELADRSVCVSACDQTPRIQETFLVVEHLLCEWIEWALFSSQHSRNHNKERDERKA